MDNSVVVSLRDIVVEFDGQRILDGLNLDIHDKEFVTVFSMNFRKIFGNVQKHLLQYIFCQIRIAHNFVSGMVDQPFVGIIYIYKLFFTALIVKSG